MKKRSQARRKGETWWPGHAETDPQGSWTGKPEDPMETPVQDAASSNACRASCSL